MRPPSCGADDLAEGDELRHAPAALVAAATADAARREREVVPEREAPGEEAGVRLGDRDIIEESLVEI